MKIGLDGRMVRITGIGRYIEQLATHLKDQAELTLLLSPKDVEWWQETHAEIPYIEVPEPIYSWSEQLVLPARLRKEEFDLIHFTNFNIPLSWREPFVLTLHDLTPLTFAGERRRSWVSRQAYRQVLKHSLQYAREVIVPSKSVARQVNEWSQTGNLTVIPHGLPDQFFSPMSDELSLDAFCGKHQIERPYVLYVGNFRNHKNITNLLKGFADFQAEIEHVQLVLAGPITQVQRSALQDLIDVWQLNDRVVITGELTDADLIRCYDGASIYILPSYLEGFGLTALEAAARGIPVIASQTLPVREFLGRAALTFDPHEPRQLTDALVHLWCNPLLAAEQSKRGQIIARTRNWAEVARETLAVYERSVIKTVKKTKSV
jgi:glycosyltransferase involved in cell wall biosynthesis